MAVSRARTRSNWLWILWVMESYKWSICGFVSGGWN